MALKVGWTNLALSCFCYVSACFAALRSCALELCLVAVLWTCALESSVLCTCFGVVLQSCFVSTLLMLFCFDRTSKRRKPCLIHGLGHPLSPAQFNTKGTFEKIIMSPYWWYTAAQSMQSIAHNEQGKNKKEMEKGLLHTQCTECSTLLV